jgi:hypothetical protein
MKPADIALFTLCLCAPALADPPADRAAAPEPTVAALLALQRSGQLAATQRQTLPGDAQARVWQRYLDSFTRPIPTRYVDDAFKEK